MGAHLAELLKRETFNLYTSLKLRNIAIHQADQRLLRWLVGHQLIFPGTTSVTLVGVDDVQAFVDICVSRNERREANRTGAKREREQRDADLTAGGTDVQVHASNEESEVIYCKGAVQE